ncbi:glycosyltransferase [Pengzhenrongella frigida]|uniref:Glycosyltransferase family 1 protein n=1 Tax=Pengzhenrongella frigida TaxID=1259133 RepID=A0A4Q5N020_9MICO|nr:glycosyltransferase [Cellulomonas sp. HLT2-17]RYV51345.1 glycosyltransferase family 1 protein [Cellulomonas sp. HLT2-17]
MKVAMVMPMAPESAIADVMSQAIPGLRSNWDLEIWCPTEESYRSCSVPLRPYAEANTDVVNALAAFDLVVYVLGDSPWHSRILPLAHSLPGLVVLHDASLTNLVRFVAIEGNDLEALVERVELERGPELAGILRSASPPGGAAEWLRFCAEVPLDDVAAEGSLGAVVHSVWHARRVDGLTLGHVTVAPLPVPSPHIGFESNERASSSALISELPDDALLLVTVGAANANRRIDLLLEAIAKDPVLTENVHLWAVGPATEDARAELGGLARTLGLQNQFAMTGRVTDSLLQEILARADIAAALRDPVLEGQSASVLTQLISGTPVVVFDHAHYAELPDDVAIKVDPQDALEGVRVALRILVDDGADRGRRGDRAREYVRESRSGAKYAEALLEAGELALAAKPIAYLNADLGSRLRRLGLNREPMFVNAVTDLAFDLFDLG